MMASPAYYVDGKRVDQWESNQPNHITLVKMCKVCGEREAMNGVDICEQCWEDMT